MNLIRFINEKKRHIISASAFLIVFAIIMGVFINSIYLRLDSIQKQNDLLSSNINSLKALSEMLRSSIGDLEQNIGANSEDQLYLTSLKSDVERVYAELSEFSDLKEDVKNLMLLEASLYQLNKKLENINRMMKSANPVEPENMNSIETSARPDELENMNNTETPEKQADEETTISDSNVSDDTVPSVPASENIIKAGNEITVTVRADTVSDMYGYQFNLNFDKNKVSYKGGLKSSINEISTIFKKDNPDYLLIGATMIGDKPGYTGNDVDICSLIFTANEDLDPSTFTVSRVNTVDSNQKYTENVSGWSCEVKVN